MISAAPTLFGSIQLQSMTISRACVNSGNKTLPWSYEAQDIGARSMRTCPPIALRRACCSPERLQNTATIGTVRGTIGDRGRLPRGAVIGGKRGRWGHPQGKLELVSIAKAVGAWVQTGRWRERRPANAPALSPPRAGGPARTARRAPSRCRSAGTRRRAAAPLRSVLGRVHLASRSAAPRRSTSRRSLPSSAAAASA